MSARFSCADCDAVVDAELGSNEADDFLAAHLRVTIDPNPVRGETPE